MIFTPRDSVRTLVEQSLTHDWAIYWTIKNRIFKKRTVSESAIRRALAALVEEEKAEGRRNSAGRQWRLKQS